MQYKLSTIAAAAMVAASALASASAQAQSADTPTFAFSGFGTVGAVHSSEKNADFTASAQQPTGAGRTDNISTSVDSRLGAQLSANIGNGFSAVLQVVSEQRPDGAWTPVVEWANLKYAFNDDLSIRVGRIALPVMMYSNSRKVGLTVPTVRAPVETYRNSIISSNDGIDLSYRSHFGEVNNTAIFVYGKKNLDIPDAATPGATSGLKLTNTMGVIDTVEIGDLTLRASYIRTKVTVNSLLPLVGSPIPQLAAIGRLGDAQPSKSISVAGSYDPGTWFIVAEAAQLTSAPGGKFRSEYVIGGYRIGAFTPYGMVSAGKQVDKAPLPGSTSATQTTVAAGLRWDFRQNADLKVQFDHINVGDNAVGTFSNFSPAFRPGGSANVATVVVDFTF